MNLLMLTIPTHLRDESYARLGVIQTHKWLDAATKCADNLMSKWMLKPVKVLKSDSINLSILCSDLGGAKMVLRVPRNFASGRAETNALISWDGKYTPAVMASDDGSGGFLYRYYSLEPQSSMDYAKMIEALTYIHSTDYLGHKYPSLEENIIRRLEDAWKLFIIPPYAKWLPDLYIAQTILEDILFDSNNIVLLHGNLKARNVLDNNSSPIFIEAQPCLGNSLFDIALLLSDSHELGLAGENISKIEKLLPREQANKLWQLTWALSVIDYKPYENLINDKREAFINDYRSRA